MFVYLQYTISYFVCACGAYKLRMAWSLMHQRQTLFPILSELN